MGGIRIHIFPGHAAKKWNLFYGPPLVGLAAVVMLPSASTSVALAISGAQKSVKRFRNEPAERSGRCWPHSAVVLLSHIEMRHIFSIKALPPFFLRGPLWHAIVWFKGRSSSGPMETSLLRDTLRSWKFHVISMGWYQNNHTNWLTVTVIKRKVRTPNVKQYVTFIYS